uniref:BTB domain-containing protein n=1 Tax=Caenorhabditis japonica TaxID=281687 RepID=A0A8R1DTW6_CAEJA
MFTGGLREAGQRVVPIKEVDVEVLSQLVDYMYTGRIRLDEQNVQTILATASLLQFTCVRDACARFMLELLDITNCVGMAEFARAHACHQLAHAAHLYTRQHFVEIIENEELLTLDKEAFCELIQDDRITVPNEEPVLQAVLNWVNHDRSNRKGYLAELISNIKNDAACLNIVIEGLDQLRAHEAGSMGPEDVSEVDIVNKKWFLAREPMPESQHIMVVGGQAPKAITNVDLFDPDSQLWSSCASLPQRRCRSGVSVCMGYVYTTGGFNGAQRVKSVDYYDPRTDTWRTANQMTARRSTHGITTCHKVLYAVGGFDGTSGLASAEYYDPVIGNWFPLPSMSTRRSSVGVAAIGNDIYAVGGFDGASKHEKGEKQRPVMVHRAVLGSVERMTAILTESFGGKWPFWLSPRQCKIITVHESVRDYARQVKEKIFDAGFEIEYEEQCGDTMNKQVRNAQLAQFNFILVIGAKEKENGTVNVRTRDNAVRGEVPLDKLISKFRRFAEEYVADTEKAEEWA